MAKKRLRKSVLNRTRKVRGQLTHRLHRGVTKKPRSGQVVYFGNQILLCPESEVTMECTAITQEYATELTLSQGLNKNIGEIKK
jgi:hypothetical protein